MTMMKYPIGTIFTWSDKVGNSLEGQKGQVIEKNNVDRDLYKVLVIVGEDKGLYLMSNYNTWTDIKLPLNRNGANKL